MEHGLAIVALVLLPVGIVAGFVAGLDAFVVYFVWVLLLVALGTTAVGARAAVPWVLLLLVFWFGVVIAHFVA